MVVVNLIPPMLKVETKKYAHYDGMIRPVSFQSLIVPYKSLIAPYKPLITSLQARSNTTIAYEQKCAHFTSLAFAKGTKPIIKVSDCQAKFT
jgi:hypothetical protein